MNLLSQYSVQKVMVEGMWPLISQLLDLTIINSHKGLTSTLISIFKSIHLVTSSLEASVWIEFGTIQLRYDKSEKVLNFISMITAQNSSIVPTSLGDKCIISWSKSHPWVTNKILLDQQLHIINICSPVHNHMTTLTTIIWKKIVIQHQSIPLKL